MHNSNNLIEIQNKRYQSKTKHKQSVSTFSGYLQQKMVAYLFYLVWNNLYNTVKILEYFQCAIIEQ